MVKSSSFYNNISGKNLSAAKTGVKNAKGKVDNFMNSKQVKSKTKKLDFINNTESNFNNIVSKSKQAKRVSSAKENLNNIRTSNKEYIRRGDRQSFIRNLFDSDVRKTRRNIGYAENELENAQRGFENYKSTAKNLINQSKKEVTGELNKLKADNNFEQMKSNLNDSNKAYRKALRNTALTRVGTAGAIGYGAKKINDYSDRENSDFE